MWKIWRIGDWSVVVCGVVRWLGLPTRLVCERIGLLLGLVLKSFVSASGGLKLSVV